MQANLFRFMNARPAQRATAAILQDFVVHTHPPDDPPTALVQGLQRFRDAGDRSGMQNFARSFLVAGPPSYISDLQQLKLPIAAFDREVLAQPRATDGPALLAIVNTVFGQNPSAVPVHASYLPDRQGVADSLLAHYMVAGSQVAPSHLARALQLFGLLERLANNSSPQIGLNAVIALPETLYPLPPIVDTLRARRQQEHAARLARYQASVTRAETTARNVSSYEAVIEELLETYDRERVSATTAALGLIAAVRPEGHGEALAMPAASPSTSPQGVFLTPATLSGMSRTARSVLAAMHVTDQVSALEAVGRLEDRISHLTRELYVGARPSPIVLVGGALVNAGPAAGPWDLLAPPNSSPAPCPLPDSCPPGAPLGPTSTSAPIFQGPGVLNSLICRMGDLMVVEQTLQRYELGEIAHVENVLIGESKERTHRRKQTVEESLFQETEVTEETQHDLQTTERFELQNESQEIINEDVSREAGLKIAGKYGWVNFTADARAARDTAREESNRSATSYSREVVDRAVTRIQERTLRRQTRRTVEEFEETNLHRLDNTWHSTNTVGVYRWIDKVYRAQVANYGQRLLLELVVTEPAAFLKHATSTRLSAAPDLIKPEAPGYCRQGSSTFVHLQPSDLSRCNYLFWAAKYRAADISPPPALVRVIANAYANSEIQGNKAAQADALLTVPPGYVATAAWLRYERAFSANLNNPSEVRAFVGRQRIDTYAALDFEDAIVPFSYLAVNTLAFIANLEIECRRTQAAYEAWQMATYEAIMLAYREQLADYEQQLNSIRFEQGPTFRGTNPLHNRQIEQDELKRSAISILSGQDFADFTSVVVDPDLGYPQLDFQRVDQEGPYIRFFEQAFEWENMSYLFYPYYWSRKDQWITSILLTDNDPSFAQFLRAGAARVVIPVRPEFEKATASYLAHGWPIQEGQDAAVPGSSDAAPYLSLVAEIQAQQGYNGATGPGTVQVVQNQASVVGTGTAFDAVEDLDREIHISGGRYRIVAVGGPTQIALDRPFTGPSSSGLRYALGPQFVGEPWEVRVPTTLVALQSDSTLPVFR